MDVKLYQKQSYLQGSLASEAWTSMQHGNSSSTIIHFKRLFQITKLLIELERDREREI